MIFPPVVNLGVGRHWQAIDRKGMALMGQLLYILELTYVSMLTAVKLSMMAFYGRLFEVHSIRLPVYIITGMTIAWWIASVSPHNWYTLLL